MRWNSFIVPALVCLPLALTAACGDDDGETTTNADEAATDTSGNDDVGSESESGSESGSESADSSSESDTAEATTESETTEGETTESETTEGETTEGETTEGETTEGETEEGETTEGETEGETTGGEEQCDCAENTDLIYVLSDDAELWSFDPLTEQFDQITAALGCPENSSFSMSVDRSGLAHVMFQNGEMYTIDVNAPDMCADPGYDPDQLGFNLYGMGFVSNGMFDPCDKLYAHSWSGMGGFGEGPNVGRLGRMDADDLVMEEIGFLNYDGGELTGTGDGRLFAFAGDPAKIVEYDKSDASVVGTDMLNMNLTNAFAFAFYGGDFYLFTESNGNPSVSQVTHFDYDDDKSLETVVAAAPIRIVGAGVSTCVPLAQ